MKKLSFFLLCSLFYATMINAQIVDSGTTGQCAWTLTGTPSDLTLTISGTGAMGDYQSSGAGMAPWRVNNGYSISTVIIENGVTRIGANAFYACTEVSSATIPGSVTIIGDAAFNRCITLYSITIPNGVTEIGKEVFMFTHLTSVNIPASVTTIGTAAFRNIDRLNSIEVAAGNNHYSSMDGILFDKDQKTLLQFPMGRLENSYTIPSGVTVIDANAFSSCNKLHSVSIPAGVTVIGNSAFAHCTGLVSVNIPAGVTSIGYFAFYNCPGLTSITIPSGVTTIGFSAFDSCTGLVSVNIPVGVTVINTYTFQSCTSLASVTIPDGVTAIGDYAFWNCLSLDSVSISASVTEIGDYAFEWCEKLKSVTCLSPVPPDIPYNGFNNVDIAECILYVPEDKLSLYQNTDVWKEFGNIVAFETEITLTLNQEEIYLLTGATATLTASFADEVSGVITVLWNSSYPDVATVDAAGTVTAIKVGTTVITSSFGSMEATCIVTVIQPGQSFIKGTINNSGTENMRVNLYIKAEETGQTKRGIVGGYVLLATTVPNGNGEYSFENLPEGSYQVQVEIEDYEPEVTDEIPLSENKNLTDVNFTVEEGRIMVNADISTGAEELVASELKAYPNPFTDAVRITGAVVETGRAPSLQVTNTTGSVVYTQTITNPDEIIRLGHLPAGMYIIRLENSGIVKTVKAIKN